MGQKTIFTASLFWVLAAFYLTASSALPSTFNRPNLRWFESERDGNQQLPPTIPLRVPVSTLRMPSDENELKCLMMSSDETTTTTKADEELQLKECHTNFSSPAPITTLMRSFRVVTIGVGTPPKEFRVLTEWESTDFWLYGSAELANKGEANKGWYDSNLSSTARPKSGIEIDFWDLQMGTIISGQVVTDTFTVGNHSVPNVAFGVATKYNYLVREPEEFGMPVDGKMGFTLLDSSGSVKRLIPSPMFGLVARASLPIMTILQKTSSYDWNESFLDGSLTIGAINSDECIADEFETNSLHYEAFIPGGPAGLPHVTIKSLKFSDGFDASIEPRPAVIVEGVGIVLTAEETSQIAHHLAEFKVHRMGAGFYTLPCKSRGMLPSIRLELGHDIYTQRKGQQMSVTLDLNQFIINYRKKMCMLMVFGMNKSLQDPVLIGNQMFQGKCMAINPRRQIIAFANQKASSNGQ